MLFYSFSAQWKHFKKWKMGSVVIHLKYGVQKLKVSLNFCPLKKCSCPACWLHKNITQSVFSKDQISFSLYSQSQSYHEKWNEWKILSFTMICKNWRIKKKKGHCNETYVNSKGSSFHHFKSLLSISKCHISCGWTSRWKVSLPHRPAWADRHLRLQASLKHSVWVIRVNWRSF